MNYPFYNHKWLSLQIHFVLKNAWFNISIAPPVFLGSFLTPYTFFNFYLITYLYLMYVPSIQSVARSDLFIQFEHLLFIWSVQTI